MCTVPIKLIHESRLKGCGKNDDNDMPEARVGFYLKQAVIAVFAGHVEVEEKDMRKFVAFICQVFHQFFPVMHRGVACREPQVIQHIFKEVAIIRIIINMENIQLFNIHG
jgi:hypothetical protein